MSSVIKQLSTYFLLLLGISTFSQSTLKQDIRSERYLYFNAGALLNIPSGIQIGYEQRIAGSWYWDIEGGILLFSKTPTIMDFNAKNKKGIRLQTGVKVNLTEHFFIGPQFLYKKVSMDEKEWFWRNVDEYEQRFDTHRIRRTYAVAAELGWHFPFETSPLSVEIAYALGVQNFNVRYDSILPKDVSFEQLQDIGTQPGTSIFPFFNYRIKIKYALDWDDPIEERVKQKEKESNERKTKKQNKGKQKTRPVDRP